MALTLHEGFALIECTGLIGGSAIWPRPSPFRACVSRGDGRLLRRSGQDGARAGTLVVFNHWQAKGIDP
jgi:hypothetical protein